MLFCCEIWDRASGYLLNSIALLQLIIIRMVHRTCHLEHTKPLLKLSFILTFPDLMGYAMAILMFKAFHNILTHKCTNFRRQFASNAGIRLWNASPDDITNKYSIHLKKKIYQVQLFKLLIN